MEFKALRKFQERLAALGVDLALHLGSQGGLRGLFDPHSSEYLSLTMVERIEKLERFYAAGFTIETMREPFVDVMGARGHDRVTAHHDFNDGVYAITDYLIKFRLLSPLEQLAEQSE